MVRGENAKKNLFRVPVIGWLLKRTYVMPISRETAGTESLRESLRRMEHGFLVGIFPEGTRSRDGELGPFKKGGFHLAIASGADIVPCGIRGSRHVMPRGSMLIYPGPIHVEVGEPISTAGLTDDDRDALLERVRAQILEMTTSPAKATGPS